MRQIPKAGLTAAVALVFATAANAAVNTTASSARVTVPGTQSAPFQSNAPRIAGSTPTSTSGSSGTSTPTTTTGVQGGTTVDQRDQQTRAATAATHASGSTSALGTLANGSVAVNAPTGTTSGEGATGTGVSTLPPFAGTPIFANPSDTTTGFANTTTQSTNGFASTDVFGNASVMASPGVIVSEAQANGASVDRAINQVSRDRKRVGRNGQLLYSIAPRTDVDRTAQMPDDPLPPSLTGSNSTLVR